MGGHHFEYPYSLLHTHTLIYPIASPLSLTWFIMAYSFIQPCILFLTRVRGGGGGGAALVRFLLINWICEHYEHCAILRLFFLTSLFVYFLLHFASSYRLSFSLVSIISIRFTFISFCMMMTCSHPRATSQVCHTLRSAYRF